MTETVKTGTAALQVMTSKPVTSKPVDVRDGTLKTSAGREWTISPELHPDPETARFLGANFTALPSRHIAWDIRWSFGDGPDPAPEFKSIEVAKSTGASFKDADLSGYQFDYVVFENADFSGANFRGAEFYHTRFIGCRFSGVDMRGAQLFACEIEDPQPGADPSRAPNFAGATIHNVTIVSGESGWKRSSPTTGLHGANFRGAKIMAVDATRSSLVGAQFEGARLIDVKFTCSDLTQARFDGADCDSLHLVDSNIRGATFVRATLDLVRLSRVYSSLSVQSSDDLKRTDPPCFDRATIQRAEFQGCKLPGASFVGATFKHVKPSWKYGVPEDMSKRPDAYRQLAARRDDAFTPVRGDLRWADFREANIDRSAFTDFRMDGAKFDGANVAGSGFIRCAFGDASLTEEQGVQEDALVYCTSADNSALATLVTKYPPREVDPSTWPPGMMERMFPQVAPVGPGLAMA